MNNLIRKSTTPYGMFIVAILFLITMAIISISSVTHAASTNVPQRGRLITIHDRGTEKVILSEAATIGDALKEANVTIDSKDAVEPAVSEKLVASDYQVNIYRARPVIIVDGSIRQKIMTPYQTAGQITTSAGITLYPEDKTTISRIDNLTEGAGIQLTIVRSTPITFVLYGKVTTIRTLASTVGEMLKNKGINLESEDSLSVPVSQLIVSGMTIELWRNGKQTLNVDEDVPFDTQQIEDANQSVGYTQIQTPGIVGKKNVTYEVDMKNGIEVSRTQIQSVVIQQPVQEVKVIGSKPVVLPYTGGGDKAEWMTEAGIADDDRGYVDYIISHESGWNPNSVNKYSGACGLAQAYPCGKVPGNPLNPIDSLRWANVYVDKFGGWSGAYEHWKVYKSY